MNTYNFYKKLEGGDLQHLNSVKAETQAKAEKSMTGMIFRIRKGETIYCIKSSAIAKVVEKKTK